MLGETSKGFCLREEALFYGSSTEERAEDIEACRATCPMPLSDGEVCGDGMRRRPDQAAEFGTRCPYNRNGLEVDRIGLVFITYPECNGEGR